MTTESVSRFAEAAALAFGAVLSVLVVTYTLF